MKKLLLSIAVLGTMATVANASMSYECWMYKDGKPMWYINVSADNKSEATSKAYPRFKDLGRSGDYVKCH
jgi:hypothetical protein